MQKITERQALLLTQGAKITGSMVEALQYSFEQFYTTDPIEELEAFCKFVDEEVGGCSMGNIKQLHKAWVEHDVVFISALAAKISAIKHHTQ